VALTAPIITNVAITKKIIKKYSVQNFINSGKEYEDTANIYYTPRRNITFTEAVVTKPTVV
jgi:hypothetical protein